jgi:hypothetical protein
MHLEIVKHPEAPLFDREDRGLILKQIIEEMASGKFPSSEEYRQVIRQASLCSLWFFGKFIAGYSGPFDLLNYDLHVDMANFRQTLLYPGCRGAMFLPRGHYKSAILTEAGTAWELVRNADLRIRITNAIEDRARDFFINIKGIFDDNDMFSWLFPLFVPQKKTGERWNRTELVLPNRSRNFREPNLEYGGITGASEGHHYDLHVIDDMIGLAALNSMRASNAVMEDTRNWFWGSEKTLLVSMKTSRVIVIGTRYAVDDVYDEIATRAHKMMGYPMEYFEENPKGKWVIYYRMGIEDGEVIFPENFTHEAYEELAEDDWWTYITQYMNNPQGAGLATFTNYDSRECLLDQEKNAGEYIIVIPQQGERGEERIPLSDCDVVISADPASTDRGITAKTSRSAVVVLATDPKGRHFILWLRADFVATWQLFNWLFEAHEKFERYVRCTLLEVNGPYKLLGPELRREEQKRMRFLNLRDFPSLGEKVARIQSTLDPVYASERLFVVKHHKLQLEEEKRAFPQSKKKDILDALSSAIMNSFRPMNEKESRLKALADEGFRNRFTSPWGGY